MSNNGSIYIASFIYFIEVNYMDDVKRIVEGRIVEVNNGENGVQAYIKVETKNDEMMLVTVRPGGRFLVTKLLGNKVF